MAIFDLYSKRRAKETGGLPDVYSYDFIPNALRVQIVHVWGDAFGPPKTYGSKADEIYEAMAGILRREYGVFALPNDNDRNPRAGNEYHEVKEFFLCCKDVGRALDVIELSCRLIENVAGESYYNNRGNAPEIAEQAIEEINERFNENAIGYQYSDQILVRLDSELMHSEVVRPALEMLAKREYAGAQQEFLKAHEHYRHGRKSESLIECYKAFESIMKSICDKRGWTYDKNKAAAHLIDICLANGLIPAFWQNNFAGLRTLLENAVPPARNKRAGHGAGTTPTVIPDEMVPYVLHMTAATILFLGEADARLPRP